MVAYHHVIQKEVDELLVDGASDVLLLVFSRMFVVHRYMGGLCTIFILKWFSLCMHIPDIK